VGTSSSPPNLSRPVTTGTGLLQGEETLLHAHLAVTTAGSAGDRRGALAGAGAAALVAGDQGGHADVDGGAAHRFFQGQLQVVAQIGATIDALTGAATAAPAEDIAEHVTEDVREAGATETAGAGRRARIHAGVTELVVGGAFLGVGEDVVGLLGFLELLQRLLVVRIAIRMVLHGQTLEGLLDFGLGGRAADTEDFIVVTLGHRSLSGCLRADAGRIVPNCRP